MAERPPPTRVLEHATEVRLLERVLALVESGEKDVVPEPGSLSVAAYIDPQRFAREVEVLFRTQPSIVARSAELAEPGDFVTHDALSVPILLARGRDGQVRAMLNVCRHRGTRVVSEERGKRLRFVCPYHAWTYENDGTLARITDAEGFPTLNRDERGLAQLPVAERHGFVWVVPSASPSLRPSPALDVAAWLGALDADFATLDLASHVGYRPTRMRKACNWKIAVEIFLEAYHVRYAHARSIAPIFFDNLGVFERLGAHQRNLFPKRTVSMLAGTDPTTWRLREHSNLLYVVAPSTLMLVQPDHVSVFTVAPDGLDACTIDAVTLLPAPPTDEKVRAYWDKNVDILVAAVSEDFAMGESIQRGLRSGANERFVLGRYEQSLAWFHESVERALAAALL